MNINTQEGLDYLYNWWDNILWWCQYQLPEILFFICAMIFYVGLVSFIIMFLTAAYLCMDKYLNERR